MPSGYFLDVLQEGLHTELSVEGNDRDRDLDESRPIILVDSKEAQIVAYLDGTPTLKPRDVDFTNDYISSFGLGDSSHRGLGFCDEFEATTGGTESSSKQMEVEEKEGLSFDSSSSEKEMDAEESINRGVGEDMAEEKTIEALTPKKNSAFLSIGGIKLFTEDISDGESDGNADESPDDESSESSEAGKPVELFESDGSEDTSDSDLDIDEEVAEDYLEGIGGDINILDAKWLVENDLDEDSSSSSGSFNETLEKLGRIALQDASRRYGMKKPQSRKKNSIAARDVWSSALDDLMIVKDPRTVSAKKKRVARLPQSWPLEAQKIKSSRKFPGNVFFF